MTAYADGSVARSHGSGAHSPRRARRGVTWTLLIAAMPIGPRLRAAAAAQALAAGVIDAGLPEPDAAALHAPVSAGTQPGTAGLASNTAGQMGDGTDAPNAAAALQAVGFDARMRASRAVVIIAPRLDEKTLLGSLPFEIATCARQAGVPAYAITRENALTPFDARILDLQAVIVARSARGLKRAGAMLADIL